MISSRLFSIATQIMVMSIIIAVVLLLLGIGVLVLLHIIIVGRAFRQGLSTMTRAESSRGKMCNGLSPRDLEELPCFEFNGGGDQKGCGLFDCAICLENFQAGDRCRLLSACNHSFHAHCVDSWLMKIPVCPICRTNARHHRKGGGEALEAGVVLGLREHRAVVLGFPVSHEASSFPASTLE